MCSWTATNPISSVAIGPRTLFTRDITLTSPSSRSLAGLRHLAGGQQVTRVVNQNPLDVIPGDSSFLQDRDEAHEHVVVWRLAGRLTDRVADCVAREEDAAGVAGLDQL